MVIVPAGSRRKNSAARRGLGAERRLHRPAKRPGIERGVAVEVRLDALEVAPGGGRLDQTAAQQLLHVLDVLRVTALDLGERLRVRSK